MRTLERNKQLLYLCEKYEDDDKVFYRQPKPFYENYTPTNSEGDLIGIGMTYPVYLRIKSDITNKDRYKPGDRLYVYKTPPKEHDVLARDCDYIVSEEPSKTINQIEVILKRLSENQ